MHTIRDFEKTYLKELMDNAPDVLVVDLFSDARFGCLALDSGLVTNNEWKLHESAFFKSIVSPQAISMVVDESQYLGRFRKAAEELKEFCREYLSDALVVLNSARAVDVYVKQGQWKSFGQMANKDLNARWGELDEVFAEVMECPRIRVDMQGMMSDENHPWGPGPVHYENAFYRGFQSQLLRIMNARTVLAVAPAPHLDQHALGNAQPFR